MRSSATPVRGSRRTSRLAAAALLVGAGAIATPAAAAAETTPAGRTVWASAFGARGDGRTDDTAALQRALDSLDPGDTLRLTAWRTYPHRDVLRVRTDGVTVTGGTLRATDPGSSSVQVLADDVALRSMTIASTAATTRGGTWEDTALLLRGTDGVTVDRVRVEGSTSAGVMVTASTDFALTDVTVKDTLADGIHITDGSARGTVTDAVVKNSGDDGIAVVSYRGGGTPAVSDVRVVSPTVRGTTWGRGLSVVGGTDITFTDVDVRDSDAAAVYIASEANWGTDAPTRITVSGGTLTGSNKSSTVDHGAVLVYSGDPLRPARDITVEDLTIKNTAARASRETGVLGAATHVVFDGIRIVGGGGRTPFLSNDPRSTWSLTGWTLDGGAMTDRDG